MLRLLPMTIMKKTSDTATTEDMYRLYYCVGLTMPFFK